MSKQPVSLVAVSVGLVLGWIAAATPAQPHTAGWSVITSASSASTAPVIGRIDRNGKMTTVLAGSAMPANVNAPAGTLDFDDKVYVVALLSKGINGSLLLVDRSGTLLQTIQVLGKPPASGGGYVTDVIMNPDGDFIVVKGVGGGATPGLLKVDRARHVTTIYQGTPLTEAKLVTTDINTGKFLLLDSTARRVFSVAPNGSAITSVGVFPATASLNTQIAQDIRTGDLFVGSWASQGGLLFRMSTGGVASTFLAAGLTAVYGVHADRSTAANPRLVAGALGPLPCVCFVDLTTKAVTTLHTGTTIVYQVIPDREVGTIKRGPGQWEFSMHFQGQSGNAYVAGLSFSGVWPGLTLPDGRRINLHVDPLTALSVNGLLGPLFTGYAGTLDAFDRAAAFLDVSGLPALKGIPIWAQVITLNPSAPLGIQTIADPVILLL
jgi:hypothetical protein